MPDNYKDIAEPSLWRRWCRPLKAATDIATASRQALSVAQSTKRKYVTRAQQTERPATNSEPAALSDAIDIDNADQVRAGEWLSTQSQKQTALAPDIAASPHHQLDGNIRKQLEQLLDRRLPSVTLYSNSTVDRMTDKYQVDALTRGKNILVRQDKLRTHATEGLALLGHELTHSTQSEPRSAQTRQRQERQALDNERRILEQLPPLTPASRDTDIRRPAAFTAPDPTTRAGNVIELNAPTPNITPPTPNITPPARVSQAAPATPAQTPTGYQAASRSRDTNTTPGSTSAQAAVLSSAQVQALKDEMYHDLMDRIRSEFERGG